MLTAVVLCPYRIMALNHISKRPFIIQGLTICFLVSLTRGEWDDWMWGGEEEGVEPSSTSTTTEEPRQKTWDEDGLCDHDPLTVIILKFILETKKGMVTGMPGLPPMDPFHMDQMLHELTGTRHNYKVIANLTDIDAVGLSNFNVTNVTPNMIDMAANVSLFMETLTVSGKYHLKGMARMLIPIPIYAKGRVIITTRNINVSSYVQIGFSEENDLIIKELDYHMSFEKVDVEFKGLTGRVLNRAFTPIMESIGKTMFEKMEPRMHDKIRSRAIKGINKAMMDMEYDFDMWMEVLDHTIDCYFS